jgi:hypothetical protein
MLAAFVTFMSFFIRQKQLEKSNIINNFGCYTFVYCLDAQCPVPIYREKWPGSWTKQWFYVNNDLIKRKYVDRIIQRSIMSHFGIKRPVIVVGDGYPPGPPEG